LTLCDLHFHLNIYRCRKDNLKMLLEEYRLAIEKSNLRFLASTEHIYKEPLTSYLHLSDLCQDLQVVIIPGLEWISREGIEVLFWLETQEDLESALRTLKPFSHSIWETSKLKEDLGAVCCIPHPFTPGKTGAARNLGPKGFELLLDQADYVEKHNGIGRQFADFSLYNHFSCLLPRMRRTVELTASLPCEYCRPGLGWSVGSDAHFPGELYLAGQHEAMACSDWFAALKARLHFNKVDLPTHRPRSGHFRRNWSSLVSVMDEALMKRKFR
jgi:hypothetical protein